DDPLSRTIEVAWERNLDANGQNTRGYVIATRRTFDLDGDGLVDVARLAAPLANEAPLGAARGVQVLVNFGDHFQPYSMSKTDSAGWYPWLRNVVAYDAMDWHGATDLSDTDGDGLPEGQGFDATYCSDPNSGFGLCGMGATSWRARRLPYRLLTGIDNGFGAS